MLAFCPSSTGCLRDSGSLRVVLHPQQLVNLCRLAVQHFFNVLKSTYSSTLGCWSKVVQVGRRWYKLVEGGTSWSKVVQVGRRWYKLVEGCTSWSKMVQSRHSSEDTKLTLRRKPQPPPERMHLTCGQLHLITSNHSPRN